MYKGAKPSQVASKRPPYISLETHALHHEH